jgi:predicted RNA binding protein YcfA (HicA-like mRNA interferase family)
MPRLSPVKSQKLIKFLKNQGFIEIRQHGSHKFFSHKDGRTTVVPFHSRKDIGKGLLSKILEDIQISVSEYQKNKK